jgi:hypothetical protein
MRGKPIHQRKSLLLTAYWTCPLIAYTNRMGNYSEASYFPKLVGLIFINCPKLPTDGFINDQYSNVGADNKGRALHESRFYCR